MMELGERVVSGEAGARGGIRPDGSAPHRPGLRPLACGCPLPRPERPAMTDTTPQQPDAEVIELAGRLFDAARAGDSALLAAYLDGGAPADLLNERGDSLVMLAAYHGHADTVRVLLDHGAHPDLVNDRG